MVEVLSQRRNNHHCCHIFGPIQHLHRGGRQSDGDGSRGQRCRSDEPFSKHQIADRRAACNDVVCKVKRRRSPEKLIHERICASTAG